MTCSKEDDLIRAIELFNQRRQRGDGAQVARSLCSGLGLLSDLFYARMHFDVEQEFGVDSMLVPISELRTQRATKSEIELFQVVESTLAASQYGYVGSDEDWYLDWLGHLRLGDAFGDETSAARVAQYRSKSADDRRLALTDVLLQVLPESRRAPLVLFRLMPLAVHIATALAFGDHATAAEVRARQIACLPSIRDCHRCRGEVADNGDLCEVCGSPLWRYEWLTVTD